jgi:hypothetical protein
LQAEAIDWRTPFEELADAEDGASGEFGVRGSEFGVAGNSEGGSRAAWVWRNLAALVEFARLHPAAWKTVEARLRQPCASYAEVARTLATPETTVRRHLREAADKCPALKAAIVGAHDRAHSSAPVRRRGGPACPPLNAAETRRP